MGSGSYHPRVPAGGDWNRRGRLNWAQVLQKPDAGAGYHLQAPASWNTDVYMPQGARKLQMPDAGTGYLLRAPVRGTAGSCGKLLYLILEYQTPKSLQRAQKLQKPEAGTASG